MTDETGELKNEVAALKSENEKLKTKIKGLSGIPDKAGEMKEMLFDKMKEAAAAAAKEKAGFQEALNAKSEELRKAEEMFLYSEETVESQEEEIASQGETIDKLKEWIYNLKVDLTGMEVMFLFAGERSEDIDIDELVKRTVEHQAATRGGVQHAVDATAESYQIP